MTEAWLRGPVAGVPEPLMPVAHSLIDAREDLDAAVAGLRPELLWARPGGVASVGFHLRHVAGSLDRLLTYARGDALSADQLRTLGSEDDPGDPPEEGHVLLREVHGAMDGALEILRSTPVDTLDEARKVGRAGLPSTVRGLLFHAAEHTRRHVGQVIATAGILKAGAAWPDPRLVRPDGELERTRTSGSPIRRAGPQDRAALTRMRQALWPESSEEEVETLLGGPDPRTVVFLATDKEGGACGFAEVGLRAYAEGCRSSPVAYLEGIWVDPEARRAGVAEALVREAACWAEAVGCSELASDAHPENVVSLDFHRAVGFEEDSRAVCFRADVGALLR